MDGSSSRRSPGDVTTQDPGSKTPTSTSISSSTNYIRLYSHHHGRDDRTLLPGPIAWTAPYCPHLIAQHDGRIEEAQRGWQGCGRTSSSSRPGYAM